MSKDGLIYPKLCQNFSILPIRQESNVVKGRILFYQRWVNHLDPKINREKWSIEEERKIFDSHKINGNKWKIIAKQLDNRTDNSIKNHFYSILRKGLRRLNKLIGDRKST